MRVLCYAQTNIGSGRDNNEDNYYCNGTFKRDAAAPVAEAAAEQESKRLIYGVFDGMGGEANGEQAALLCAQTLHQCSSDEPFDALDFFRRANVAVCDMIAASGQVSGSTAATVHLTGNHAYCCNVGDSRIYLQRGGALQRISRDHTKYQEQLDDGAARRDADDSPDRHVLTQYLGMLGARQRLMPYFAAGVPLAVGDRLLLCTDGLTGKLSDSRLQAVLGANMPLPELGQALMAQALDAGASDNITLVLIEVTALDPETAVPPAAAAGRGAVTDAAVRGIGRADRRAGVPAQEACARAPARDHPDRGRRAGCARRRDRGAMARSRQHPAQAPCPRAHAGADGGAHADAHTKRPAAGDPAPDADARTGAVPGGHAGTVARRDARARDRRTGKVTRLTRGGAMRIIAYERFDTFRA